MKIYSIETGNFKCDGGAMFSVVPKFMWSRKYPADDDNMCKNAIRSILIHTDDDRKILVDTGIGNKFSREDLISFNVFGEDSLENSLTNAGFSPEDITDVLFTHLHFDHAGGAVKWDSDKNPYLLFPNAVHWVSEEQYLNHQHPNVRESDAYFERDIALIREKGLLRFIKDGQELAKGVNIRFFNGHTPGLAIPFIQHNDNTFVYTGDFIPTSANINIKWIASYDIEPLKSLKEKEDFFKEALQNRYKLIFQHDLYTEGCSLNSTPNGAKLKERFKISDIE